MRCNVDYVLDHVWAFLQYFWSVFSFWALWQCCDWMLGKLKIKLRKPWVLGSKKDDAEPLHSKSATVE